MGCYTTTVKPIWVFFSTASDAAECADSCGDPVDIDSLATVTAIIEPPETDTEVNLKCTVVQTKYDAVKICTADSTDDKMVSPGASQISSCVLS